MVNGMTNNAICWMRVAGQRFGNLTQDLEIPKQVPNLLIWHKEIRGCRHADEKYLFMTGGEIYKWTR
jgi:hypothetical protein